MKNLVLAVIATLSVTSAFAMETPPAFEPAPMDVAPVDVSTEVAPLPADAGVVPSVDGAPVVAEMMPPVQGEMAPPAEGEMVPAPVEGEMVPPPAI